MGVPNIFQTGRLGMQASKAAIATTGHNIANANTEGFSRQRVHTETAPPQQAGGSKALVGSGTLISSVERVNDEYIEKALRNSNRDLSHYEEKDLVLKQTEDIFNELNGAGVNRLLSRFFNEFRKLSNEPDNEAVRQSVREASQSLANDFHRIRADVEGVQAHIDARIEGHTQEVNALANDIRDLNTRIQHQELGGASANDLCDKRDVALKKLASFMDISSRKENNNQITVEIKGVGPLVVGPNAERTYVERTPADEQGKAENAYDLKTSASAAATITHAVKGGKIGALLEVRDQTLTTILDRLDELAMNVTNAVNEIHEQGFNRHGEQGISFFKPIDTKERAAEFFDLSDEVKNNVNNIAAAAVPDAAGDNRISLAISSLQGARLMNEGKATADDWYNSMVSEVGVAASKNQFALSQQRDIMTQLGKMRDQVSGVSIDEETANLMQFQHSFDASAKVIQVADELLKTVLELKR
jgi:flagellar hook-associated protein 1 FlgK